MMDRQEQWRQDYSDMLHDAAERWGVGIPGRPLLLGRDEDERFHIPVVETLTFPKIKKTSGGVHGNRAAEAQRPMVLLFRI